MKKIILILVSTLTLIISASVFVSADTVTSTLDFTNVGSGAGQTAASGDAYTWKDKTLTINNLELDVPADSENDTYGIILPAGSTIVVKGSNSISVGASGRFSYGLKAAGNLTIKGSGTLNVKAGSVSSLNCASYGLYAEGNLSASSCKLNIESGLANTKSRGCASYGAYVVGKATFNGGNCAFTATDACSRSIGLMITNTLALKSSATVSGTSGSTKNDYHNSCGIYAEKGIDVSLACSLVANGGQTSGAYADAIALYSDGYIKTGGSITAAAAKAKGTGGNSYAIYAGSGITAVGQFTVKNAKGSFASGKTKKLEQKSSAAVEIVCASGPIFDLGNGEYSSDASDHTWPGYVFVGWYDNAEYTGSEITSGFEDGKTYYAKWKLSDDEVLVNPLDFTSQAAPTSGRGFTWDVATQTLTLNKFQMKITSEFDDDTYGIKLPDGATIVLTDGTSNTIKSGNSSGCTYAVYCNGALAITGNGSLKATGGKAKVKAYGIYTAGGLSSSGNIVAKAGKGISGKAQYANGINCKGAVDVTAGSIKAYGGYGESEANGIWASSALSISNGASVECYCYEKLGVKSLTLDVTKVNLEEKAQLDVKGTISCGKYGGEYYVNGAKISRLKTSGNANFGPSSTGPIRIRNFNVLAKHLVLKAKAATNIQVLSWTKIDSCDGYDLYFSKIDETPEKIATFDKSVTSFNLSKLSNTGKYKMYMKAYVRDGENITYTLTSPTVFSAGRNADRSNATALSVNKKSATMSVGDTLALSAKVSKKSSSKTLLYKNYCKELRYLSSDQTIATISSKGKITAKSPGQCYVYVVAPNGLYKSVKISVF